MLGIFVFCASGWTLLLCHEGNVKTFCLPFSASLLLQLFFLSFLTLWIKPSHNHYSFLQLCWFRVYRMRDESPISANRKSTPSSPSSPKKLQFVLFFLVPPVQNLFALLFSIPNRNYLKLSSSLATVKSNLQLHMPAVSWTAGRTLLSFFFDKFCCLHEQNPCCHSTAHSF